MRCYANQLNQELRKSSQPFYLVFGEEPYQEQRAVDSIRHHFTLQGYDEIIKFAHLPNFDWQSVTAQYQSMSLFSARTLIEIDLMQTKPAASGTAVLKAFAEQPNQDVVLVLKNLPANQETQRTAWFKALEKQGLFVPCYPLSGMHLTRWLDEQCKQLSLQMTPKAKTTLLDATEGNLLACHQEVQKLSLLFGQNVVDESTLLKGLLNQSKFNVFDLNNALLAGNKALICKVMAKLMTDNVEPMSIVWALQKEAQLLCDLHFGQIGGTSWAALCKKLSIWKNQESAYKTALNRLSLTSLQAILTALAQLDDAYKHQAIAAPYQALLHIALQFATPIPFDLPLLREG
ncbi:DNA polymerase III delta subunit [Pseudoalteromonas luteoviolacea B = ATCC 29581]|nr:DNA polymerase III delta subunit [Pseudoalteromonas luteoviolacea B = ATCC 29581]